MSQRRSRNFPFGVVIGGAVGAVVVLGGFFVVRARNSTEPVDPSASASPSSVAALEALIAAPTGSGMPGTPDDPGQPRGQILSKKSLPEAISVARPLMANTVGRLDVGSALLALWSSRALTWEALDAIPETSPALFRKDPDSERGRRFCISGTILQIRAEKTLAARVVEDRTLPLVQRASGGSLIPGAPAPQQEAPPAVDPSAQSANSDLFGPTMDLSVPSDGKVYVATIQTKQEPAVDAPRGSRSTSARDGLIAEIIAVKSTGALVDGSEARACGILTGVTLPANDATSAAIGDIPEHRIVGMFDLPENHGG